MSNQRVKIKSFSDIKNLAIFKDFTWNREVQDAAGKPVHFATLNIIYGRNYSGKTTLSRIVRALRTAALPDKYDNPQFTVTFSDGTEVTQSSLPNHGLEFRVFNEDFVRDNLAVVVDDQKHVAAFAVLGEDNAALAAQLATKEAELGSENVPTTLIAHAATRQAELLSAEEAHNRSQNDLDVLLRDEARRIKEDGRYSDVNYDIRKIKADIQIVSADTYFPLNPERVAAKDSVLKETAKDTIEALPDLDPQLESLESRARTLLSRAIQPSKAIQDLLNDAILQKWVRQGRRLHEGKRTTCAFCGNPLSDELWLKLEEHFSEESETLRSELQSLVGDNGPRTVVEEFQRIKSTDVVLPTSSGRDVKIRCVTTPDRAQRILLDRLGVRLPTRLGEPQWHVGDIECSQ